MLDIGTKHIENLRAEEKQLVDELKRALAIARAAIDNFAAAMALTSGEFEAAATERLEHFKHGFPPPPEPPAIMPLPPVEPRTAALAAIDDRDELAGLIEIAKLDDKAAAQGNDHDDA